MVINTNTSALQTANLLEQSSAALSQSLARLSSGSKITSPADDSAGLAVSMELNAQMGDNSAASNNISNAISFNQTQDGYLSQVANALDRMSELAEQAQDVTKSASDRSLYQQEFSTLATYITNVANQTFNGVSLFNGTNVDVPVDSQGSTFHNLGVNLATDGTITGLTDLSVTNAAGAALTAVQSAIADLASDRANLGSNIETLTDYNNQLQTLNTNLAAANSQIMDVDVATESTNYATQNILVQSGTAMLAQANALPQLALKLIGV